MKIIAALFALGAGLAHAQNLQPQVFSQPDGGAAATTYLDRGRTHKYATDFAGVKCDNRNDDTVGMRAAVTSLSRNSAALRIPGRGGDASPCRISGDLQMPTNYGVGLIGESPYSSIIRQTSTSANAVTFNRTYVPGQYYATFRDVGLTGPQSGTGYGIDMRGSHAFTLNNVVITGFGGAGVRLDDSIIGNYQGCRVQGNTKGFYSDGTGIGVTASNWNGCYVSGNTQYGYDLYSLWGSALTGTAIEGNGYGGVRVTTTGGGIFAGGTYTEENHNSGAQPNFDWFIGSGSYVRGFHITGSLINGLAAGQTYDYRPIRLKFADAHKYEHLYLVTGNRLYWFDSSAVVTNSFFGPVGYDPAVDLSDPSTIYDNVPADLLTYRSRINDPQVVPTDGQNLFTGTVPYAWTTALGAGSTWVATAPLFNGQPVAALSRTTATAQVYRETTLSATSNARARNRFTSFCADLAVTDAAQKNVSITLGDGTSSAVVTYGLSSATPQQRYCVSLKVSNSATTLTSIVEITSDNGTVNIGNESLFVGMDYDAAPQYAGIPMPFRHNLEGSTTWDPANVANGASASTTVTVSGAELGDFASCSFSLALSGLGMTAEVSAAGTVTCRLINNSGGAVDLGSGTVRARASKKTTSLNLPIFAANDSFYSQRSAA